MTNVEPRTEITMTLERVDPKRAALWLKQNIHNRVLSRPVIAGYARQMRNGLWLANGDVIRFSDTGVILDGQHRLLAIVESGVTLDLWVARGLPMAAQVTMDLQRKRTAGDSLGLEGYMNGNALAALVRMVYRWDFGERSLYGFSGSTNHLSTSEVLEVVRGDKDPYSETVVRSRTSLLPPRALGTLSILANRTDALLANHFIQSFHDGANLEPDSPILALRKYCIRNSLDKTKTLTTGMYLNACVRSWNAYATNKPMSQVGGWKSEKVPEIRSRTHPDSTEEN